MRDRDRVQAARSLRQRAAGVLLHPTSLPGGHGIGDLGPEAHAFLDFLAGAGQGWWQVLPVGPTGAGDSPYSTLSTFAGNPSLVSLDALAARGLLAAADLAGAAGTVPGRVDYGAVIPAKDRCLRLAARRFAATADPVERRRFAAYVRASRSWLEDFALFTALRTAYGHTWTGWPPAVRERKPRALAAERRRLAEEIDLVRFVQYQFDRQWSELRAAAAARGIGIIGDVPIYVALDSADVWAHPEVFDLEPSGEPRVVAGVPPDYFSPTGQLWGNPLYRWDRLGKSGYRWWIDRLRQAFRRFDAVRLDHFIGFHRYWEVEAGAADASRGRFRPGPRAALFAALRRTLGEVELFAEDLGLVVPAVDRLRERAGLPGTSVLQFAFGDDDPRNRYRPHTYGRRTVVYTGTHDNDTTVGWFRALEGWGEGGLRERERALRYAASDGSEIHWDLVRLAWMSVADTAIAPAQDLLGLGSEARLNRPGVAAGNWTWRLAARLPPEVARRLRELTETYGRRAGA